MLCWKTDILPTDQQPCTMAFCEVVECEKNGGKEEAHLFADPTKSDASEMKKMPIDRNAEIVTNEKDLL